MRSENTLYYGCSGAVNIIVHGFPLCYSRGQLNHKRHLVVKSRYTRLVRSMALYQIGLKIFTPAEP